MQENGHTHTATVPELLGHVDTHCVKQTQENWCMLYKDVRIKLETIKTMSIHSIYLKVESKTRKHWLIELSYHLE